jgi:hypothetical protein
MKLPDDFKFSQASLQDFVDCRRRFQLRYLERLAWPALQAEPALENERRMQLGQAFHQRLHQYLAGVPQASLDALATGGELAEWWAAFLNALPGLPGLGDAPPEQRRLYPEVALMAPLPNGQPLVAKYDLLAARADGAWIIFDWKTSARRPRREHVAARLQTRVYPYLLARAGTGLNGGTPIAPAHIEMIYWYAHFPERPERFRYSDAQFQADGGYLEQLTGEIAALEAADFWLTPNTAQCRFCQYRSLCDRGVEAGPADEFDAFADEGGASPEAFELDFGSVDEIAF